MTLLIGRAELERRREMASGPLASLADSLASELDRLLLDGDIFIPAEKAKLTRRGGRCERDGTLLEFDPREPRRHRCATCGRVYQDEVHYRWWVMGYQLWLAERAVHAAVLWALRGRTRHRQLAGRILEGLADRYLTYPNIDNALGPTRVFFSTYLESIWLLQLAVALDLIERVEGRSSLGHTVRDRLVEPSAQLIASFDEGGSNRQVWNSAAVAAVGRLTDRGELVDAALFGTSGLTWLLEHALLPDGTWYEGENYHLFAHRGLWYLVTMAEQVGAAIPDRLVRRFDDGFTTPFLTALPDFTFPSRRDSQYGVSLRQWRIAESCELGHARAPDDRRLLGALGELYRQDVAPGDAARWRSTAEAERNAPGVRLTRDDLGWKSLLAAAPAPPSASPPEPRSALLDGQGFAVLRRRGGRVYVALDYGHSGGGHGHPDRLNLWLVDGERRVLEDVGTGSYVDRSLHWYRSTLAHNAPLVDGRSQLPVDGELLAWDEDGASGWVDASARISPGTVVRRSIAVMDEYLVDRLDWSSSQPVVIDLPIHGSGELSNGVTWRPRRLSGGDGLEDGFTFVEQAECAGALPTARLDTGAVRAWILADEPHEWWRGVAPGPPGSGPRRFLLIRARGSSGTITGVWSWSSSLLSVGRAADALSVSLNGGTTHLHRRDGDRWRIEVSGAPDRAIRVLDGARRREMRDGAPQHVPSPIDTRLMIPLLRRTPAEVGELTRWSSDPPAAAVLRFRLSRQHYRRSEQTWSEAGSPEALVSLGATDDELLIEVSVRKPELVFAPARGENELDNEHSDVNSDGVQLYVQAEQGAKSAHHHAWIVVPQPGSDQVRVTERLSEGGSVRLRGTWRVTPQGYQVLLRVPRRPAGLIGSGLVRVEVMVNEISPGRERRRGQLVLSGAPGERVYLRGDRGDPHRYVPLRIANA